MNLNKRYVLSRNVDNKIVIYTYFNLKINKIVRVKQNSITKTNTPLTNIHEDSQTQTDTSSGKAKPT